MLTAYNQNGAIPLEFTETWSVVSFIYNFSKNHSMSEKIIFFCVKFFLVKFKLNHLCIKNHELYWDLRCSKSPIKFFFYLFFLILYFVLSVVSL